RTIRAPQAAVSVTRRPGAPGSRCPVVVNMLTALHYRSRLTYLLEPGAISDHPNRDRPPSSSTLVLVHTAKTALTSTASQGLGPLEALAFARLLLDSVKAGRSGATLRVYSPAPT